MKLDSLTSSNNEITCMFTNYSDRQLVDFYVMGDFNLELQLLAIKSLLCRNREAEEDSIREIECLYERARQAEQTYSPYQDEEWVDRTFESFFHDVAHSMAAVGMLAPFVEALFVRIFQYFQHEEQNTRPANTENQRRQLAENEYWNPYLLFKNRSRRKDIAEGIIQLADSVGLTEFFPNDYEKILRALYRYRNKMFHYGFLWPEVERKNFRKTLRDYDWPDDWFQETTHNGNPYIFYMSDKFIDQCVETIDGILNGVGAYYRSLNKEKFAQTLKGMPKVDFSNLN